MGTGYRLNWEGTWQERLNFLTTVSRDFFEEQKIVNHITSQALDFLFLREG